MTAWLLRLVPQYVGSQSRPYTVWWCSSIVWLAVFVTATLNVDLSNATYSAFGVAATSLGALGAIDIATHRLPRQITYLSMVIVTVLLLLGASSVRAKFTDLMSGLMLMFLMIGSLRVLSRGTLGKGDLHLAPLLGVLIGWFDPYRVVAACVVMAISGALVSIVLVLTKQRKSSDYIAYGPFMLFGTAIAILGVTL